MKNIIFGFIMATLSLTACNNNSNKANENANSSGDTTQTSTQANSAETKGTSSVAGIVSGYLHVKNALADDDGNGAANGGKEIVDAMQKFDKTSLTEEQKKTYDDVADDIKEHGEHISTNGSNVAHQREHFDVLSKDMYDLVKALGSGQKLYYDHCPMYNKNKGADWLSETKEIKNPYLGKEMPTCGTVKEEIKQ